MDAHHLFPPIRRRLCVEGHESSVLIHDDPFILSDQDYTLAARATQVLTKDRWNRRFQLMP